MTTTSTGTKVGETEDGRGRRTVKTMPAETASPPTADSPPAPPAETAPVAAEPPRRTRRGRKRLRFARLPRPAYPVRALWELATPEEKELAHRRCVLILEWWLGKSTRQDVAGKLSLPPLRVWQLGQQALSGMLAGLLRQPKTRPRSASEAFGEERPDAAGLRREIAELRKRLKVADEVNSVLRELRSTVEARPAAKKAAVKPVSVKARAPRAKEATPGASTTSVKA